MREKDRGIWQTFTWREYYDQVRDLALGLAALGFKRGDRLSVIGDNRPRLYWAQMAAMSLGGISVPVYQDAIAKELADVCNHAEVAALIGEGRGQVDRDVTPDTALAVAGTFVAEEDVRPTDEYLPYLPMAWAGDATYTLFASLAAGFTVSCPESPETVQRDLRELGPTTLLAPPRIWENML